MPDRGFRTPSHRKLVVAAGAALLALLASAPAAAAENAIAFAIEDARPFVRVSVNGQPLHFLVDTGGAGLNVLSARAARQLGLAGRAAGAMEGANERALQAKEVTVDHFRFGSISMEHAQFSVADLSPLERRIGFRLDGIVGYAAMAGHRIRFDYPRRTIMIDPAKPLEATAIQARIESGWPVVQATVDEVSGSFLLDTGDRSYLTLFTPFARTHYPENVRKLRGVTTGFGLVAPIVTDLTRTQLHLGDLLLPDVVTRLATQRRGGFASPLLAGSIGSASLLQSVVDVDYNAGTVTIMPEAVQQHSEWDQAGMWLSFDGKTLDVDGVIVHGPAWKAGLRDGDRLTAVGATSARDVDLPTLRATLAHPSSRKLVVTRYVNGRSQTMHVDLTPLL